MGLLALELPLIYLLQSVSYEETVLLNLLLSVLEILLADSILPVEVVGTDHRSLLGETTRLLNSSLSQFDAVAY